MLFFNLLLEEKKEKDYQIPTINFFLLFKSFSTTKMDFFLFMSSMRWDELDGSCLMPQSFLKKINIGRDR